MLAVAAFSGFWVLVALILFLIAARPGRSGRYSRAGTRSSVTMFVVTTAVFGLALPALTLTGNHNNASAQVGGLTLTAGQKAGRELFGEHCGVCHTLAAANAAGKVGPDLDVLQPSYSVVLRTINNGCLPNAPSGSSQSCLGMGVMPADVVQGRQAQQVAAYVAKVAGRE